MQPVVIAELLLKYGLPLTQQLVQWSHEKKETVTPEDMALLAILASYSSTASLAARGVEIRDGKAVPA